MRSRIWLALDYVRLLAVLALLVGLAPVLSSCSEASDRGAQQGYPEFNLQGKDESARLDTLRAVARTAAVDVFYLGDPYDGMTMVRITAYSIGEDRPWSVIIDYGDSSGNAHLTLLLHTPRQFENSGYRGRAQNPLIKTFPIQGGTANVYQTPNEPGSPPGPTTVIARTERTVLVMVSEPDIGPERMSDAAAHLVPVTR